VLFLFVVLLLPHGGREQRPGRARAVAAAVGGLSLFAALALLCARAGAPPSAPAPAGSVAAIGASLFGPLLVPFELTALPMLLAIVGAVTAWRRQEQAAP